MKKTITVACALLFVSLTFACSDDAKDSCSCDVENQNQKKLLGCGETACIGGTTFSCSTNANLTVGASCTIADAGTAD